MSVGHEYWRALALRAETDLEAAVARAEAAEAEAARYREALEEIALPALAAPALTAWAVDRARRALSEEQR